MINDPLLYCNPVALQKDTICMKTWIAPGDATLLHHQVDKSQHNILIPVLGMHYNRILGVMNGMQ